MIENYQKYLPVGDMEEVWTLSVLNTGSNRIKVNGEYPSRDHSMHHYFTWENGRILDEYQLIYISKGAGFFESASCKQTPVTHGTILIIFPGEWHRFKPDTATGWDEFWIGCKGTMIRNMESGALINRSSPILPIGMSEEVAYLFTEIIKFAKDEKIGYQFYISGIAMHLLGLVIYKVKQLEGGLNDGVEDLITRSQFILRSMSNQNFRIDDVATELNVSYSWFRKAFKKYTGISPKQYVLQLKIEQAKTMLSNPLTPVKEIAFELNFESASFFSKQFKKKTGKRPELYRITRP